jgi:anti-sigma regulatory factor (Ser/Thr protein kinase)
MEVITGCLHVPFTMDDSSRVGEARRFGAVLGGRAALDEVQAGKLALIVTELGTNLVRHARSGTLLLAVREAAGEVEVVAIDRGPGIADVAQSLGDGFSTGSTPGTGLGAVRRLASDFDIHSAVPDGTIIIARVRRTGVATLGEPHSIRAAGICVAVTGEQVCGDAWAIALDGTRAGLVVADGLGHGPAAAQASCAALAGFVEEPLADPRRQIERAHANLRGTRGAAVSALHLDAEGAVIRSSGAGNIAARVISGSRDRALLSQHGTVGLQIRKPEEATLDWPPHALVVVHSDGLETRWTPERLWPVLGRDPLLAAAILLRDHSRGRDDATVVVVRRAD